MSIIKNIVRNPLNFSSFGRKLINSSLQDIIKAYTEGVYADTFNNRKLGRVGMTYAEYEAKVKAEKEEEFNFRPFESILNEIKENPNTKGIFINLKDEEKGVNKENIESISIIDFDTNESEFSVNLNKISDDEISKLADLSSSKESSKEEGMILISGKGIKEKFDLKKEDESDEYIQSLEEKNYKNEYIPKIFQNMFTHATLDEMKKYGNILDRMNYFLEKNFKANNLDINNIKNLSFELDKDGFISKINVERKKDSQNTELEDKVIDTIFDGKSYDSFSYANNPLRSTYLSDYIKEQKGTWDKQKNDFESYLVLTLPTGELGKDGLVAIKGDKGRVLFFEDASFKGKEFSGSASDIKSIIDSTMNKIQTLSKDKEFLGKATKAQMKTKILDLYKEELNSYKKSHPKKIVVKENASLL